MAYGTQPNNLLQATGQVWGVERYDPSPKERELVSKIYTDFVYDQSLKNQSWNVLNNRTLAQFWEASNYDYNVIVSDDVNNPVTQYSSGISRDKANTFISNLTLAIQYPSVTAQNENQEIDTVVSRIARPILRWQYMNDGRPSESGKLKNVRYTHKQVVEGTVHILDTIGADGKLTSSIVPNENVFIPNFYQPNIQLQGHFLIVDQWASFAEAEALYGDRPNFKYVVPGSLGWLQQTFEFKERYKSIVYDNQCTIVKAWYPVRDEEVARLKKIGKLPKNCKKAKYFNILINDVPMFAWDNLMPYYHGELPITKAVFENFSPSDYYWGNSMPNKCAQDKHFRDGWLTLMRFKGKLNAIPPLLNMTGQHIENNVYVPGVTTDLPNVTDPKLISTIPGISGGVTNSDVALLQGTDKEIDRATASPQTSGQQTGREQTARESMIIEQNEQKILQGFAQQISFREEARAFPILKASFQFLTRQQIARVAIPDETFSDGSTGTLEVIFEKVPDMTPDERLERSHAILAKQRETGKAGRAVKQVFVDPDYVQNLDLYCEAVADTLVAQNSAFKEAKAEYKWNIYSAHPELFNQQRAARKLVTELGDNPQEMILPPPPPQNTVLPMMGEGQQPGVAPGMGQTPPPQAPPAAARPPTMPAF